MEANIEERLDRIEQLLTSYSLSNKVVFNIDETADYTGLSKLYLYKLTSKGEIPHSKPNGKNIYFKKEEIDNWLLRNKVQTNEEISSEAANFIVQNSKLSI